MYVTRPLSLYKEYPSALSLPPPDGPNSGVLVVQDIDAERKCCFSTLIDHFIIDLPFPQNRKLNLEYSFGYKHHKSSDHFYGVFIPVLDQPLSSNHYYVVQTRGQHAGRVYTSSSEDQKATFCCCKVLRDVPPKQFDPNNVYQQFKIKPSASYYNHEGYEAISISADGVPPYLFRRPGWTAHTGELPGFESMEAQGLNSALRAQYPEFKFSLPCKSSNPMVVGKWYCPFIFIRDGAVDVQMEKSMYYEMTLQRNWEEVFGCGNYDGGRAVHLDVSVDKEVVSVEGRAVVGRNNVADGVVWFSPSVGLSSAIVERIKWEEERDGFEWVEGKQKENKVNVKRKEEFQGVDLWKRFGCYVLVETFVLKRIDGSLVLTWEFRHTHKIRSKWE